MFFNPSHNGLWPPISKVFYPRLYPLHFFSYLNSPESISLFNVECQTRKLLVPFITSLVWRGPWLGIEPWISRTRSQHSTTRLSKRRLSILYNIMYLTKLRHSNTFISLYVYVTAIHLFHYTSTSQQYIHFIIRLRHSNTFISLYVTYTMLSGFV